MVGMSMMQQDIVVDERYLEIFKDVTIYGVAGANASGKDGLMDLLVDHGFLQYHTSNSIRRISQAVFKSTDRGGNEAPMGIIGNAMRSVYPGGPVELGLLDWWLAVSVLPEELRPKGLVIGSIRAVGEVERLKQVGGKLIVVDADQRVRYDRIMSRQRADDPVSFEVFKEHEDAELAHGETDPTKFGMAAVIDSADITIVNNGDSIEDFRKQVIETLHLG